MMNTQSTTTTAEADAAEAVPPKTGGLGQLAAGAMTDAVANAPSLGSLIAGATKALASELLPAGKCTLVIQDVQAGATPSNGITWARLACGSPDQGGREVSLILPVEVDPSAMMDDGEGNTIFNPDVVPAQTARGAVQGLKRLGHLCTIANIGINEIASADDLDSLIGTAFVAVVTVGKDRDDIPENRVKSIVGPAPVDPAGPVVSDTASVDTVPLDDVPF